MLERTLRREVKEEVGIEINNIEYVTSLATVHKDGGMFVQAHYTNNAPYLSAT